MDPKNPNQYQVSNFLIPPPQPRDASDDNKDDNHHHNNCGGSSSGRPSWGEGGGEVWPNGAGYRIGFPGFDFPGGAMSFASIFGAGGGGNGNQMLELELGLSQEGNVGVLNQQIYQQMAQAQAQGRVLHHTLHHNPGHEDHQQESCGRDESQGSF
ncbi:hypothetical protein IGI04_033109 [Brassica rapa subsp. trilocularis]|uniref:Uncharacterized protein n=1 Tax=Brassica rapa subsp. trilocularis TaxID=1813537 RepID=A0ABQ7L4X5_BRACM|nr:hypothetical protein IGI04_033109 [Brassica rapa subsp. trilocularis]